MATLKSKMGKLGSYQNLPYYPGYGAGHLNSADPTLQQSYDRGVLTNKRLDNQASLIKNWNTDPWMTAGTMLGAIAADLKNNYDERGAQKTADSIFNSLPLGGGGPPQEGQNYEQKGEAISMNNPTGDPNVQAPSPLDDIAKGISAGNAWEQGVAQNLRNGLFQYALGKWGSDPNANQTALALQEATDGVNSNFVLGGGPTRSQMIASAEQQARQRGLNSNQIAALKARVGEAYDARYDSDLKRYRQEATTQFQDLMAKGDYKGANGLLASVANIDPTTAGNLGTLMSNQIKADYDAQQLGLKQQEIDIQRQNLSRLIDEGKRKAGVDDELLVGGYQSPFTDDFVAKVQDDIRINGADAPSPIPDGKGGWLNNQQAVNHMLADRARNSRGIHVNDAVTLGAAEAFGLPRNADGSVNQDALYTLLYSKKDLMTKARGRYNSGLTEKLRSYGMLPQNTTALQWTLEQEDARKKKEAKKQQQTQKENSWLDNIGNANAADVDKENEANYYGGSDDAHDTKSEAERKRLWFDNPNRK